MPLMPEEDKERRKQRFAKHVSKCSDDPFLVECAKELLILYGDPDAPMPRGLMNANVKAEQC